MTIMIETPLGDLPEGSRLYFIGIGGIGMSALARIFKRKGFAVSGSDQHGSDILDELRAEGIPVDLGHDHRPTGIALAVFSSAIHPENPQRVWFESQRIKVVHRSALLAYLMNHSYSIGVTGTHGKTTTSSLIAFLAERSGRDPSVLIGGYMKNYGSNALYGSGNLTIAEVDESDKSQLACHPRITVITNLEPDHLEHYQNMNEILNVFRLYCEQLSPEASLVYCGDEKPLSSLVKELPNLKTSYGFSSDNDVFATDISHFQGKTSFLLHRHGREPLPVLLPILGEHNVLNSMAAIIVLEMLGIEQKKVIELLKDFQGVARRMDFLYESASLKVVDDYAHHPTEIRQVIQTLKRQNRRLVVAYEAHRYSRTKHLLEDFGPAFEGVDVLILTDIYPAGETPIAGVDLPGLYQAVKGRFEGNCYMESREGLMAAIDSLRQPGDLVAFLGAGEITHIAKKYASVAKSKEMSLKKPLVL